MAAGPGRQHIWPEAERLRQVLERYADVLPAGRRRLGPSPRFEQELSGRRGGHTGSAKRCELVPPHREQRSGDGERRCFAAAPFEVFDVRINRTREAGHVGSRRRGPAAERRGILRILASSTGVMDGWSVEQLDKCAARVFRNPFHEVDQPVSGRAPSHRFTSQGRHGGRWRRTTKATAPSAVIATRAWSGLSTPSPRRPTRGRDAGKVRAVGKDGSSVPACQRGSVKRTAKRRAAAGESDSWRDPGEQTVGTLSVVYGSGRYEESAVRIRTGGRLVAARSGYKPGRKEQKPIKSHRTKNGAPKAV